MPCAMSLLILYYSALISLNLSLSLMFLCLLLCLTNFFSYPLLLSDFKICLLEHLYHKGCTTTRQSWLFSFYVAINNKQDEMQLENIRNRLQSSFILLQFFHLSVLHYTTSLFILKYFP